MKTNEYKIRDDLTKFEEGTHESLFIELQFQKTTTTTTTTNKSNYWNNLSTTK